MELEGIVPWGRSFNEYQVMFALSATDLQKSILGCGDGPACFNAQLTKAGGHIISIVLDDNRLKSGKRSLAK